MTSIFKEEDMIVIFGPGETKKRFAIIFKNYKNIKFKLLMELIQVEKMEFIHLQNLKQCMR